jgi:hypothetical protein
LSLFLSESADLSFAVEVSFAVGEESLSVGSEVFAVDFVFDDGFVVSAFFVSAFGVASFGVASFGVASFGVASFVVSVFVLSSFLVASFVVAAFVVAAFLVVADAAAFGFATSFGRTFSLSSGL